MAIEFQFNNKPEQPVINQTVPSQLARKLGSGIRIPSIIANNNWEIQSETQKVKQDIFVALATPVGLRLMQPDFGSMIPYYCHESFTPRIEYQIVNAASDALNKWVPQIIVRDVLIDESDIETHILKLVVMYVIRGTSVFDDVTIVLNAPDKVQIPPGAFVIDGLTLFSAA